MTHYTPCAERFPPERVVVETVSPGGLVQDLQRIGRLWFFPDGSAYVYYEPAMWREKRSS